MSQTFQRKRFCTVCKKEGDDVEFDDHRLAVEHVKDEHPEMAEECNGLLRAVGIRKTVRIEA